MTKANSKGMLPNGRGGKKAFKSFAGIPRIVMESEDYKKLSFAATRLLNEFAFQYRGHNNGDLTAAFHVLKERGWKSRTTIERARDELIEANLIIKTREGKFLNPGGVCALYALVWQPINECKGKKLSVDPSGKPVRPASEF